MKMYFRDPIKNGDIPASYVSCLPEGRQCVLRHFEALTNHQEQCKHGSVEHEVRVEQCDFVMTLTDLSQRISGNFQVLNCWSAAKKFPDTIDIPLVRKGGCCVVTS